MNIAVRYYSRSGNTKAIAEAIAEAVNVKAISVDEEGSSLKNTDILFVGGALYAYGLDRKLNEYLDSVRKEDVGKAAIFSSTWISKHSIELIRKKLEEKGIDVIEESFYVRGKPSADQLNEAKRFAERVIN